MAKRQRDTPATRFDGFESGVSAIVRTGRAERHGVDWSAPFETTLCLERDPQGRICGLALQTVNDWAEYDPRHQIESEPADPVALLVSEDYYLEIIAIGPNLHLKAAATNAEAGADSAERTNDAATLVRRMRP